MENTTCELDGPATATLVETAPEPIPAKAAPVEAVVPPLPRPNLTGIALEIMIGCNLRCTLCNVDKLKPQFLPVAKIEEILNKVPTIQRFIVIGHGEPLLHPDWYKIMDLGGKLSLQLHIVTNGMLLNEKHVAAFPPNAYVQFSIDSFRPEIYAAMRPGGVMIKVLRNLQLLAESRKDVRIGIQSIVTKKTFPYIDEIGDFARQFGFDFNVLYPGTVSVEKYNEHYPDKQHPRKIVTSPRPCQEPFSSLMVGINGDIYPCCYMYGSRNKEKPDDSYIHEMVDGRENRINSSDYRLGNIFTDDVYALWNESRIRGIRNTVHNSLQQSSTYAEVRDSTDMDQGYGYCRMCALRWGKVC